MKKLDNLSLCDLLSKYQCLCFNCNYVKGFWDKCAHKHSGNILPKDILPESDRGIKQTHLTKEEYKKRELVLRRIQVIKKRLEMIQAYGGKCISCNETHPLFLTLDHINNNGSCEPTSAGTDFYQHLKSFGYPGNGTQLQLLCHNCNAKKEYSDIRPNKQTSKVAEIYIRQLYSISNEEENKLREQARQLYFEINEDELIK
jgi:5-methylcytosine-specific restriction endonuclease McrA